MNGEQEKNPLIAYSYDIYFDVLQFQIPTSLLFHQKFLLKNKLKQNHVVLKAYRMYMYAILN
jgi:hypothetical protein